LPLSTDITIWDNGRAGASCAAMIRSARCDAVDVISVETLAAEIGEAVSPRSAIAR
jgi:hypothetical protein